MSTQNKTQTIQAYSRFIMAIQKKLMEGDFLMTPETFVNLMGGGQRLGKETLETYRRNNS